MSYRGSVWKSISRRGCKKEYITIALFFVGILYIASNGRKESLNTSKQRRMVKDVFIPTRTTQSVESILPQPSTPPLVASVKPLSIPSSKYMVICEATGRLGNLMFSYASAYGIAKRKNMSVAIDASNPLLKYFKLDAKIVHIKKLRGYKRLMEARACDYDQKLLEFEPNRNILIGRYLQSWKYFLHSEDLVRAQFQFSDETLAEVDTILSKIRRDRMAQVNNASVSVVGLHYRRGDKVDKNSAEYGYQMAPREYMERAMKYFRLFYDHVVFVVTSDSPEYIKGQLKDSPDTVFLEQNSAILDMAILAHCDHLIMTIGSYGWWAGFLNKGKVLYYKYPAREGSEYRKQFFYPNHFHLRWTGLS